MINKIAIAEKPVITSNIRILWKSISPWIWPLNYSYSRIRGFCSLVKNLLKRILNIYGTFFSIDFWKKFLVPLYFFYIRPYNSLNNQKMENPPRRDFRPSHEVSKNPSYKEIVQKMELISIFLWRKNNNKVIPSASSLHYINVLILTSIISYLI